jgi:flavin reductase
MNEPIGKAPGAPSFAEAMARVATGVTIVGAASASGWTGQTVSSMCRVSTSPAMLLVCINGRSPVNSVLAETRKFAVSVLGTTHDHVADTFAGRPWPGKKRWDFTCGQWEAGPSGAPRLADALACFDCELDETFVAGTHLIHLGRVQSVTTGPGQALIYADRVYSAPQAVEPSRFGSFPDAHPDNRYSSDRHAAR